MNMNKKRVLIFLCFAFVAFISCEKDDICVDGDTPLLVILFLDTENPEELKAVPSLRVIGVGRDTIVNTIADRTSLDSIALPLRINQPDTSFLLITDSATDDTDMETGNIDTLTFSYTTKEVFVSRACGFVANFDNLSDNLTSGSDNWIQSIEIDTTLVENSARAHVKIFH